MSVCKDSSQQHIKQKQQSDATIVISSKSSVIDNTSLSKDESKNCKKKIICQK